MSNVGDYRVPSEVKIGIKYCTSSTFIQIKLKGNRVNITIGIKRERLLEVGFSILVSSSGVCLPLHSFQGRRCYRKILIIIHYYYKLKNTHPLAHYCLKFVKKVFRVSCFIYLLLLFIFYYY